MKKTVIVAFFIITAFPGYSISSEFVASTPGLSAQVCFDRPENNGFVNLIETKTIMQNAPSISLIGGQAACVYVSNGFCFLKVVSANPYPQDGTKKEWASKEIKFEILGNETKSFLIIPANYDLGEWLLKEHTNSKLHSKKYY